jgi:hypothetical protein
MKIIIETIPHSQHRYPTVGDYWDDEDGTQHIVVSDMGNEDYEMAVVIHELIEKYLTKKRGIAEPDIKAFDEEFERNRARGDESEPGDDPKAPYRKEHFFASGIEMLFIGEVDAIWAEYESVVNDL